jgi:SPP1 family predicted phage head-tail adaptor
MTMNHRFTPLRPGSGRDAAGQPIPDDFAALPDRWGDVLFQTGAEVMRGNAVVSITRCSIRANASPEVTNAWRVRYLGVDYDVQSVLPDSRDRRKMFIVCESVK